MSFKCGRYYVCDICNVGTFVRDSSFDKQEPFPDGWVRLTSQLWKSGEYRYNSEVDEVPVDLNLDICDCCWEKQTIDIAALFRKQKIKESKTLH